MTKTGVIFSVLVLAVCMLGSCGIFGSGCKCPKVSYQSYPAGSRQAR